ncbi:MAG: DUF937 domain-containing protein [bacterium]|nr:DUF937 domain-containing protein [bacterium]
MSDLNQLMNLFGDSEINSLSQQIGADKGQTTAALQQAVPTLFSAIQNNVSNGGANGLMAALDRDHDGSVLDDVMGFFQGGGNSQGEGILKHLLGDNKGQVENALAANSGADASSISKLLPLIAPVIMGYLGKQKQQTGVSDSGGISDLIGKFTGGAGGLDISNIIGMFTGATETSNNTNQTQTAQSGGGILNIISNLFGKK